MTINYPGSLDNFTNPTSASPINSPSHADQHSNANDAIEALEAKVGSNNSAVTTSHDYKIAQLESLVTSAVAGAKSIYQDVRNQSGSTFTKATPVYISGSEGASGKMLISAASNASESTSSKTMGLTSSSIANNNNGQIISEGILEGIDTTGAADGDPVWLGVNGAKIYGLANKPSAPAHLVFLGIVIRGGQANTGSMYVKIQNGFELEELHNVQISSLLNGNILAYDSSTSTWKNTNTLKSTSSTVPLIIKGSTSQAANLQEWQTSTGALVGWVDGNGSAFFNSNFQINGVTAVGVSPQSTSQLIVKTNSASRIGLVVQAASSQTANIQEWQNSSGGGIAFIDPYGNLLAQGIHTYYAAIFQESDPSLTPVTVTGAMSQSANLQNWQDSSSTVLSSISSSGIISGRGLSISTPTNTTNAGTYYNAAGTPVFNVDTSLNAINIGGGLSGVANNFASTWGYDSGLNAGYMTFTTGALGSDSLAIRRTNHIASGDYTISTLGNFRLSTASGKNFNFNNGNIGIATTTIGTNNKIIVNPYSTVDNLATVQINTNAVTNKGLVVQGYPSQTANLTEWQNSSGTVISKVTADGSLQIGTGAWTTINSTYGQMGVRTDGALLGSLSVGTGNASVIGLVVKGVTSQTANLQEWQNNSGTALSYIKPDGTLYVVGNSSTAWISGPATSGTNKITANGNDLAFSPYFDGLFAPANSSGSWRPVNDATSDLGSSGQRWKDVYATSATFAINSSAKVALTIKQINPPTANMQEWQNYNGDIISSVKADGSIQAISGIFAGTITSYPGNGTYLAVRPWSATHVPFMVKGFTAATADLTRWTSDAGTTLAAINSAGDLINSAVYTRYLRGGDEQYIDAAALRIKAYNTTAPTSVIKSIISQSSNLTEWQNYLGNPVAGVSPNGDLYTAGRLRVYSDFYAMINSESSSASVVGQIIRGANSQTADLQQWQSSAGTTLSRIAPKGNIYIGATQSGLSGQINGTGTVTQNTSPLFVRGTQSGQNLIELWAYGKDAFITGAVGNGTSVTYTTAIAHGFTTSDYVIINGISQSGGSGNLNIAGGNTVSAVTTYTFTVPNTSTQTYTSGGYVRNAEYPGNILQAYRSDGMSLFTIGSSGGFAMADVMSVANVGYQQAGLSIQPNLTSSAAIRMYGRSAQTAEVLDVRNYINKSGGSDSIFAIVPDYSVSANADGYGAWVRMRNAATPATNPTSAGYLYVGSGALNYMGTSNVPQQIVGADGSVKFTSATVATVGLIVKGLSSQTANLQEWQNSAGTVLAKVDSAGSLTIGTSGTFISASNGRGVFTTSGASQIALVVKGAASQSANLQEWQNSAGTVLAKVDATGKLTSLVDGSFNGVRVGLGNSSVASNLAVGYNALNANTTGDSNLAIGSNALYSNTTGFNNVALGQNTLVAATTVNSSVAIGRYALSSVTTGSYNTGVGSASLNNTTTGQANVAIGVGTMYSNVTGGANVAIGNTALASNTGSYLNVAIGDAAGYSATGAGNIFIGYNAGYNETGANKLYIANSNTSTPLIGGDFNAKTLLLSANVVINSQSTSSPGLIVKGASGQQSYFSIQDSSGSAGIYVDQYMQMIHSTNTYFNSVVNNSGNWSISNTGNLTIKQITSNLSSTISTNTVTTVDTVALSSFTTIEYTISIKQGSKIRSSKVLVHTDGTSIDSTEYGIMEMGGGITGILVTASVSSTNSILQVTITDAATTNATVKLIKTML